VKNFIFKSSQKASDLPKIISMLNLLLNEQRNQRVDLSEIKARLRTLKTINNSIVEVTDDESSGSAEFPDE